MEFNKMWKKTINKLFPKSAYEQWWDGLSSHTKEWLKSQPIYRESDLFKAIGFGIALGFLLGFLIGFSMGTPDYSNMPVNYLRG